VDTPERPDDEPDENTHPADGAPITPQTPDGTVSPDGAWRWESNQWVPNLPTAASVPPLTSIPASQPASPLTLGSDPPSRPAARRAPSKRTLVIGGIIALLAAGVGFTVFHGGGSAKRVAHGRLTLIGGGGYTMRDPCKGTPGTQGDNEDLHGGTAVKILDASDKIIGSSLMSDGHYFTEQDPDSGDTVGYCRFTFDVDLDAASNQYQLVIAERSPFVVTDVGKIDLTLGGGRIPTG